MLTCKTLLPGQLPPPSHCLRRQYPRSSGRWRRPRFHRRRRLLSPARETRPQPPLSSVRPSQPPAALPRCWNLPSCKSHHWDCMSSRCCRRREWAIGQPLLPPLSPPPSVHPLNPSIPCLRTRGQALPCHCPTYPIEDHRPDPPPLAGRVAATLVVWAQADWSPSQAVG